MATNQEGEEPEQVALPYKLLAPIAQILKALLQMIIGVVAVAMIMGHVWASRDDMKDVSALEDFILTRIALALALAAAIELAYTLFTHGPDEALDPLMLGVAAALLLQLAKVKAFDYREGIAVALYVGALAGLFATRKWLAGKVHVGGFSPWKAPLREVVRRLPFSTTDPAQGDPVQSGDGPSPVPSASRASEEG